MFWRELPPQGGELTAYPEGDACYPKAPRAIPHSLSGCLTFPSLRCYNWLRKRDRRGMFAAREPVLLARGRLQMPVAHAGKQRPLCNARQKGWMSAWPYKSMWPWRGRCLSCTTAASQTRPGSTSVWLLLQQTARSSMLLPRQRFMVQRATSGFCGFS